MSYHKISIKALLSVLSIACLQATTVACVGGPESDMDASETESSTPVVANPCNPCGAAGFTMKASMNKSFSNGAGGTITCGTLADWATQRSKTSDVCGTIVSYARQYCNCRNAAGAAPPPLPVNSQTKTCSLGCTVLNARNERFVPNVIGSWGAKCKFIRQYAAANVFTSAQCPAVKTAAANFCCR
jgi:hypothetical protein